MYRLYIIECEDKTLYTGITTDIKRRFAEHLSGKGARYTRAHPPKKVVYKENFRSRGKAQRREAEIKSLSRAEKIKLIGNSLLY